MELNTQKNQLNCLNLFICANILIGTENIRESNKLKIGLKKPLFFLESTNDENKGTII